MSDGPSTPTAAEEDGPRVTEQTRHALPATLTTGFLILSSDSDRFRTLLRSHGDTNIQRDHEAGLDHFRARLRRIGFTDTHQNQETRSGLQTPGRTLPISSELSTKGKRKRDTAATSPWDDTIAVLVGPKEYKVTAHAHALRKSPFFRGCLDAEMREKIERTIRLPEDDPKSFEQVVFWLYSEKLEHDLEALKLSRRMSNAEAHRRIDLGCIYVRVWFLAKKLMLDTLQNTAIDLLRAVWGTYNPAYRMFKLIIDEAERTDPLRSLALRCLSATVNSCADFEKFKQDSQYLKLANNTPAALEFLSEALCDYPNTSNPARDDDACKWHVHIDTPECSKN
jgi:hypothetical protein